jgi:hypothetical protein
MINKVYISKSLIDRSKASPREYFRDTYEPRTALGTVNSEQFFAQCGSAHGLVFESVREVILLQK